MTTSTRDPVKVGVITDLTGPLSFMGIANANVADMVVHDINASGGLLGRPLELIVEDSATDDGAALAAATRMVDEHDVDVVLGGIYSSTRQAIKGPVVKRARKLYIYPEQYEGQESDALIFCTGPVPAQQVEPLIPWLMEHTGAKKFYLPSADYIWPHVLNAKVREVVVEHGGTIVGEEYYPLTTWTTTRRSTGSSRVARTSCSTRSSLPALRRSSQACTKRGSRNEEGRSCAPTSTRTSSTSFPPSRSKVSTAAWTTTGRWAIRSAPRWCRSTTAAIRAVRSSLPEVPAPACTGAEAVGGGRRGSRVSRDRAGRQVARHGEARAGTGWPRGDGARAAPPPPEHVHRAGTPWGVRGRREPRSRRAQGGPRSPRLTSSARGRLPPGRRPGPALREVRTGAGLLALWVTKGTTMDRLHTLDYGLGELRRVIGTLDDSVMDAPTTAIPGRYADWRATR